MEDRRAHERIDTIEFRMEEHRLEHKQFEQAIADNTRITQSIADNTAELVEIVKGAKGVRSFVIWAAPVAAAAMAVWAFMKGTP